MLGMLKQMLGLGAKTDFADLISRGAIIIDVRSRDEFIGGSVSGSIHIELDSLNNNLKKLNDKTKPIITCCASGARSEMAKNILKSKGYTEVYNGGSWYGLNNKIG